MKNRPFLGIFALMASGLSSLMSMGGRSRELPRETPSPEPPFKPQTLPVIGGIRIRGHRRKLQRSNYRRILPEGIPAHWKNPFRGLAVPNSTVQMEHAGRGERRRRHNEQRREDDFKAGLVVRNAMRCGICQASAHRFNNRFECSQNPAHVGDLNVGIFSDLTFTK